MPILQREWVQNLKKTIDLEGKNLSQTKEENSALISATRSDSK
jgi:hypothetical protein